MGAALFNGRFGGQARVIMGLGLSSVTRVASTMRLRGSANLHGANAEQRRKFFDLSADVADANSTMMRRTMSVPAFDEATGAEREAITAVRIPDLEDRAGFGFPFGVKKERYAGSVLNDR